MKDIVITARQQKKELCIYSVCFLLAMGVNAYAIMVKKAPWSELLTQLPYVILISLGLYILCLLFRLFLKLIFLPLNKPKSPNN